jgi:hypothetical protein
VVSLLHEVEVVRGGDLSRYPLLNGDYSSEILPDGLDLFNEYPKDY